MDHMWTRVIKRVYEVKSRNTGKDKLGEKEKIQKKNDAKSKALIFEILFYLVFLILLLISSNNSRDTRAFQYTQSIGNSIDPNKIFSKITTIDLIWDWMQSSLVPFLNCCSNISGIGFVPNEKLVSNVASYKLGPVRLRQHRVKDGLCPENADISNLIVRCSSFWSSTNRDVSNFEGTQWITSLQNRSVPLVNTENAPISENEDSNGDRQNISSAWMYRTWSDIGGLPITGNFGLYPPGGYVFDLIDYNVHVIRDTLRQLQNTKWADNRTRVLLIEFTLYSPNVNLFAMVTIMFEFPQAELVMSNVHIHPFRLFVYLGNYATAKIVCDYLVYAATVWFIFREINKMYHERLKYFLQFWNILELANVLTSIASIVLHIGRHVIIDNVSKEAKEATGQFYNFQTLAMWDQLFGFLIAFVSFMSILQILHVLRFSKRMSMLGGTMMRSASDLWSFLLVFIIALFAFISFSALVFGAFLKSYRTTLDTFESILLISMGHMEYKKMHEVSRVFTPAFIFLYLLFIVFILLNILVTILMDAFADVKEDAYKESLDYELIEYIVSKTTTKLWNYHPFRLLWSAARKMRLISNTEPASTREADKLVVEDVLVSCRSNKLTKPILRNQLQVNNDALLTDNLSMIHLKLDKLTQKIDDLLIMEGLLCIVENNENINDIFDNDYHDETSVDVHEIPKNRIRMRNDDTDHLKSSILAENETFGPDTGYDTLLASDSRGIQRMCSTPLKLTEDKQNMFDFDVDLTYNSYSIDQHVPKLEDVHIRDESPDIKYNTRVVPRSDKNRKRMNTLEVQVDVMREFNQDNV